MSREVTGRLLEEAKTGRGRAGLVPGGDESRELSGRVQQAKAKGKG